jgi:hypothetical protein
MRKLTILLVLITGLTTTSIVFAGLEGKCKVSYLQGSTDSKLFIKNEDVTQFEKDGNYTSYCEQGVDRLIKKVNKWIKNGGRDDDGVFTRTITKVKPVECKVKELSGFMWLGRTWSKYKKCKNKDNKRFLKSLKK